MEDMGTWRQGDMDIETLTWTWTWKHGHGNMDTETWTWRHGIKILGNSEVLQQKIKWKKESPGDFPYSVYHLLIV